MGVTVDAVGLQQNTTSNVTSFNYTGLTVSPFLTNSALAIMCNFSSSISTAVSAVTCTWNSVSMTQINLQSVASTTAGTSVLFALLGPATGTKTAALSWTTSAQVAVCGVSFEGVTQSSVTNAFTNNTSLSGGTNPSNLAVTGKAGDLILSVISGTAALTAPNGTQLYNESATTFQGAAQYLPSGGGGAAPSWTTGGGSAVQIGSDVVWDGTFTLGSFPRATAMDTGIVINTRMVGSM